MDLFWSGLAQRASEHAWNERRSQFSKVFETAVRDIEMKESEKSCIKGSTAYPLGTDS